MDGPAQTRRWHGQQPVHGLGGQVFPGAGIAQHGGQAGQPDAAGAAVRPGPQRGAAHYAHAARAGLSAPGPGEQGFTPPKENNP